MRSTTSPSGWATAFIDFLPADTDLPRGLKSINLTLNRIRLNEFLEAFSVDSDLQDYLILDLLAAAAGVNISSTGDLQDPPGFASRPFRLWEYVWLHKILQFSDGRRSVLDLGGPASHLTISAALAGNDVLSIDVNPRIVDAGRQCANAFRLNTYRAEVGDMRDLSSVATGSVDRIVCCSVLEHLAAEDQHLAVSEMARVLAPGGIIGLTFDYGSPAPGANCHLPPPHDPPQSVADVIRRFVHDEVEILGDVALEDPIPGSLFATREVTYTIASLFLGKAPISDPPVPVPVWSNRRVVPYFSSRDLMQHVVDNIQREQFEHTAEERLEALHRANELIGAKERQLQEIGRAAEERLDALIRANDLIQAKERQRQDMERAAVERLDALIRANNVIQAKEAELQEIGRAAEERREALVRANDLFHAKDQQLQEIEGATEERLAALARADRALKEQEQRIGEHESVLKLQSTALQNAEAALSKAEASIDELRRTINEFSQESIIDFIRRRRFQALRRGSGA